MNLNYYMYGSKTAKMNYLYPLHKLTDLSKRPQKQNRSKQCTSLSKDSSFFVIMENIFSSDNKVSVYVMYSYIC